jgi:uncharacterized protein (DUF433 family)
MAGWRDYNRQALMSINPKSYSDPREVPKYNLGEVAWYLDIPPSTLRWWCLGRTYTVNGQQRDSAALIRPALYDPHNPSLSFYNLAEAHILAATRKFEKISMQKIRDAIDYLATTYASPHPLLGHEFFAGGKDLFIKNILETVNISRKGQLAFKELVDAHLERVITDNSGWPTQVFPVRHKDTTKKPIVIVSNVGGGHPITPRKGIRVEVLMNRKQAGEAYQQIAEDYGLTQLEVEEAVRYMEAA